MNDKNGSGKRLDERLWEMQRVLQSATAGDYSARCSVSMKGISGGDPLAVIAPSVNMLIAEVENRGIELQERTLELQRNEEQLLSQREELAAKMRLIERQDAAIQELTNPVLELWDEVLVLPVIGVVDTRRAKSLMSRLLDEVAARQTRFVIIDITGVDVIDTSAADHLIRVVETVGLLGCECLLTGLRPAVAQTLVELSVDLSKITTIGNLKAGLKVCLRKLSEESP